MPPGYPECRQYTLPSALRGPTSSFAALTTITWSPTSTCGAQIGLCLPRSSLATSVARRPSTAPSASITCQARSMSLGLGLNVRTRNKRLLLQEAAQTIAVKPVACGGGGFADRRRKAGACDGDEGGTRVTAPPAAAPVHEITAERVDDAERALDVLLDGALDPIVDMVLLARDGAYEARSHDGWVRFRRTEGGGYEKITGEGADPLADQSTDKFAGLEAELAHPYPTRGENSYPFGFAQVAQLFDHPAAPDLCVIHSAAHNWEDQGGHRGEHGSLDVVQARAPFVVAGKGVRSDGLVPRAGRLVDVAPTLAELLGLAPADDGAYVRGQDGEVRDDVLDLGGGRPRHVVGFLWDGTNPNVLYAMAAAGEAPNVARLLEMGTAYLHGAMAGLPTVTLANHTSILTGRLPGHHGILNNAWFDRRSGRQIITNSSATWPTAMETLTPGVETIHDAVHRTWPDAFTASVNEPADPGADYSTFDFFRRGEVPPIPTA